MTITVRGTPVGSITCWNVICVFFFLIIIRTKSNLHPPKFPQEAAYLFAITSIEVTPPRGGVEGRWTLYGRHLVPLPNAVGVGFRFTMFARRQMLPGAIPEHRPPTVNSYYRRLGCGVVPVRFLIADRENCRVA